MIIKVKTSPVKVKKSPMKVKKITSESDKDIDISTVLMKEWGENFFLDKLY